VKAPTTLVDALAELDAGSVTATGLLETVTARAEAFDERLGVFITRTTESARRVAEESDRRRADGRQPRPLEGAPVAIKDIIATGETTTTAQSAAHSATWSERTPTASVVTRLRDAGAVVTGTVTTMEFAAGLPDPSQPFPVPRNPWNLDRWAGGSSSGSASGLVAGMFLGALGTDTAGSIRIPAAFSGTTGLKPTFGRVPKDGVVPLSWTLDHVGPMARSARDCALLLGVLAGRSTADRYSSREPVSDYLSVLTGDLTGVRIGVDRLDRHAASGIDPAQPAAFDAAVQLLIDAGADVVEVELPLYAEAVAVDMVVMLSEAASFHRQNLHARWRDYGAATRVLFASADVLTADDYVQAQRVRRVLRERVDDLFTQVDLVVTPTGHRGAPALADLDPANSLTALPSVHTPYWNPLGNPTLAVPIGLGADATPLSLSVTGRPWAEAEVLRAGDALQRRSDHHLATPSWFAVVEAVA
jgi:aspartyl-tRNA(Asn)/glutamyl-tRNA(Gln) amidotransferase subunit A